MPMYEEKKSSPSPNEKEQFDERVLAALERLEKLSKTVVIRKWLAIIGAAIISTSLLASLSPLFVYDIEEQLLYTLSGLSMIILSCLLEMPNPNKFRNVNKESVLEDQKKSLG